MGYSNSRCLENAIIKMLRAKKQNLITLGHADKSILLPSLNTFERVAQ